MVSSTRGARPVEDVARAFRHLRSLGIRAAAGIAVEQIWFTKDFFGLRAPLTPPATPRTAKIPITMLPVDAASFQGFADELAVAIGPDYTQLLLRENLRTSGIGELYVAVDDAGVPIYAQWLVRPRDQDALHAHSPGRYADFGDTEVLLEGAYTFTRFRRMGAMADGMAKLLRVAADEGMTAAYTYVEAHNIPSLRGCAEVGFVPEHVRASIRRLGRRRGVMRQVTDSDRARWEQATA